MGRFLAGMFVGTVLAFGIAFPATVRLGKPADTRERPGAIADATVSLPPPAAARAPVRTEPVVTLRNGPLTGWQVVRDDETLLCEDPMVFVRARQIECP